MATTQYIGARYVPRHMGEWDANTQYGALDVVLYTDGNSYTAKCYPPKGTPPTNGHYWSLSAQFNQQLASVENKIEENKKHTTSIVNFDTFYNGDEYADRAFSDAQNYCVQNKCALFIKAGAYKFKNTLNLWDGCVLVGEMYEYGDKDFSTKFIYEGDGNFIIAQYSKIRIENICFEGINKEATVGIEFTGINMTSCTFKKFGIGGRIGYLYNSASACIIDCKFLQNDYGFKIEKTDGKYAKNNDFYHCVFNENKTGLYLSDDSNHFYGCGVETNTEHGIIFENCLGTCIFGGYIENAGASKQIEFIGDCKHNVIMGGRYLLWSAQISGNDGSNFVAVPDINKTNNFNIDSRMLLREWGIRLNDTGAMAFLKKTADGKIGFENDYAYPYRFECDKNFAFTNAKINKYGSTGYYHGESFNKSNLDGVGVIQPGKSGFITTKLSYFVDITEDISNLLIGVHTMSEKDILCKCHIVPSSISSGDPILKIVVYNFGTVAVTPDASDIIFFVSARTGKFA